MSASSYIGSLIDGAPISPAEPRDKLLHDKLDAVIELLTSSTPSASRPEDKSTASWKPIGPAGVPDEDVLESTLAKIAGLEEELLYCQDQASAEEVYRKIDVLQKRKNAIIIERNNNE